MHAAVMHKSVAGAQKKEHLALVIIRTSIVSERLEDGGQ